MKIGALKERIEKAQVKMEKKSNTIIKKAEKAEKKAAMLNKKYGIDAETFDRFNKTARDAYGEEASDEIYWTLCEIADLKGDVKRNGKEIEEIKAMIEKYEKQMAGEIEKEAIITKDVPECLKKMQEQIVAQWDEYDISRRNFLKEEYENLEYKVFINKHKWAGYEYKDMTDEKIHEVNMRDAKSLIINLYNRVKDITGEVTKWDLIEVESGNAGFPVITGVVYGKQGKAVVETIVAGGYNIQRLHIRTLVHERA